MEKVFVAQRVASKLFATENSIDMALAEAAEMMAEMLRSRKDIGFAATLGDPAVAKVSAAIAALSLARTAMVEAHGELNDAKLRLGIRTKMDIEPKGAIEPEVRTTLREVG